jgi:pyruvate formate lyase activating enzyme
LDTGRLAREHGFKNLFKSAFFISLEGAAELCEVIDIFSISIKTMNEKLYRKITKGWLPPILEATKYVFSQGKHVEISNLMVTDANDSEDDARAVAEWVLTNLSDETPLHFVRFHPDYKYTHVGRTPIERLVHARKVVMEMGVKYCYLGNVYDNEGTNTFCHNCGHVLIERFGLNTWIRGVTADSCCQRCGTRLPFVELTTQAHAPKVDIKTEFVSPETLQERHYQWRGDVNACHVEMMNPGTETTAIYYWRMNGNGSHSGPFRSHLHGGDQYRFIISKSSPHETGVRIQYPKQIQLKLYEVFDRAHYPTVDIDTVQGESDSIPALHYIRRGGQSEQPSE